MEKELDEVADGKDSWEKTCKDFYTPFAKNLKAKYEEVVKKDLTVKTDKICPKCGSPIIERMGRFGRFYACSKFPECKYTESIEVAFFIFITMGFYLFFFNGARQGIACAIYSLAIGPMLKRNFIKYLGYVILAILFHKTAVMMLPMYFVFNRPNTFKNNLFTFVLGCIAVLFIDKLVGVASSIDARYATYGSAGGSGGYVSFGFTFLLGAFFLTFRDSVRIDRYLYDRFLNMFLFGVMIGMVSTYLGTDPSGLLRYAIYFNIAAIFLWPIVFINLHDRLSRFVIGYSFVIFYLAYFVLATQKFSDYIPYFFNPSVSAFFH